MYRTEFWTLWEKARVGCFERTASKHVYYLGWNRSPAQAGCMRQVLGPGALGRNRGIGWRGRWEGGLGWGIHVNPWLIHVNLWQKPLQYCKVISLQLKKKKKPSPTGLKWKWSRSVMSDSSQPHGLEPIRLLCPWNFPGKSTGVVCHVLLQGIFLTQGSNPGLLHCRQMLPCEPPGKPWPEMTNYLL